MHKKQKHSRITVKEHRSLRAGKLCTYALIACALTMVGCAGQQQNLTDSIHIPESSGKAETMELVEEVLGKMHFSIEKADIESGLIRTKPLPGAQFFEFWRVDNVGIDNALLANIHTIRRTVEIDIVQQGGQFRIGCEVAVQRLSLPERESFSSARAYEMYSRSSPSLQKLRFDPTQIEGMAWSNLGKDEQLAAEILRQIEKQISLRTNKQTALTGSSS